jgi:hypothetical protein
MINCNVCKIEKEEIQFQKYWHSTRNKMYIRKQCNDCYKNKQREIKKMVKERKIVQPEVLESQPDPLENLPDHKICGICKIWKPYSLFYRNKKKLQYRCIQCTKDYEKVRRTKERIDNQGGNDIKPQPNQYANEVQKNEVFKIMLSLGWKFNEDNQKWWKKGIKDSDGKFPRIKKYLSKRGIRYVRTKEVEDKMKEMRKSNKYTIEQIAMKFNVGETTVIRWTTEST